MQEKCLVALSLALFITTQWCLFAFVASTQETDRDALISFFHASNGLTSWNAARRWDVSNASSAACVNWFGVSCNSNQRVKKLNLDKTGLSGSLSPALGSMAMLEVINLQQNALSGTLPISLINCTQLLELHLQDNFLEGSFPREFSIWSRLTIFHMSNNSFTGSLPSEFNGFTSLTSFEVDQNNLNGTLPEEYSAWSKIKTFQVFRNRHLTGTLPASYGTNWSQVTKVLIYTTDISGPIPNSWGAGMTSMEQLQLFNNKLNGTIPASLGSLQKLAYLNLALNALSGEVPWTALSNLREMVVIGLQDNPFLTGTVPLELNNALAFGSAAVSICRSGICGPQLPLLLFEQHSSVDTTTMFLTFSSGKFDHEIPCSTPQPTAPTAVPSYHPASDSSSLRTQTTITASLVVVSQLISGAATSSGGLHAMQGLLRIQRLRALCDSANDSLSHGSEAEEATSCCDISTSPLQLSIDVDDNHNSVGEREAGALIGNTMFVLVFGVVRVIGSIVVTKWMSKNKRAWLTHGAPGIRNKTSNDSTQPFYSKVLEWTTVMFESFLFSRNLSSFWPSYCFSLVAKMRFLLQFHFVLCGMTPWFAANFTLQCNAQMRKAARPFSFCAAPPETKGGRLLSSSASWWKRTKAYLLLPTEDLRFVNHTVAKAVERDYGALFFGFRSSRLWSFNVELLFGVATGVVIGVTLDSSDPCGVFVFGWILVALSLIECLLAFSVRPYCAAVDFVMLAVV
ncbi:GP46-like surface antigen, putative, partial [Bodo saltans]